MNFGGLEMSKQMQAINENSHEDEVFEFPEKTQAYSFRKNSNLSKTFPRMSAFENSSTGG